MTAKPAMKHQGFSLMELMIVIAIIGLLAAIAIPNYNDYLVRSRITEAVATLSDTRVKLEQYFQDNRTYAGACTAGTVAPPPVDTNNFQFTCNLTTTTYTVDATGRNSMTGFTYRINEANVRTTVAVPSGWNGAGNTCWVVNRGGGC